MFSFFKRSKKRGNNDRKGINDTRTNADVSAKGACAHENNLAEPQIKSDRDIRLVQHNRQYENDSVDERAVSSNLSTAPKSSFFDIMAKGRSRRNSGKNKKQTQPNNNKKPEETNRRFLSMDGENIKSKNAVCEKPVSNDENVQWKIDRSTAKQKCDSVDFVVKNKFQLEDQHEQLQLPLNVRNNGVVVDIERNCVYEVRQSAENSQQKQYVGESNLDRSGALNFANAITFDKHNRPASPTSFTLQFTEEHNQSASQTQNFNEMGQQPTKQQSNKDIEQKVNTPAPMSPIEILPITNPEYFQTPPSPTVIDEIFYEADEHIVPVPDEDAILTDMISNIPVVVNENFNFTKNDHENTCVNRVPSFHIAGKTSSSSADPNYDQIIINNDAVHGICVDIPNNHDSPDSGIVDLANNEGAVDVDISQLINKLENETISSDLNGGNMKSAFKFENGFNDSNNNGVNGNSKKFGGSDGGSDKKKVVKRVTFELDSKSLPDVVTASTNGIMVIPVESNPHEEHNNHQCNGNVKRDLVNKDALFTTQLEEAEKQAVTSQAKADDLAYQINELERNLTVKTWNVERLQAELQAAYTEGECVKKKLKLQESEMAALRSKQSEKEDELNSKYNELEVKYNELQEKLSQVQKLAMVLQVQLAEAQCDASDVRREKDECVAEQEAENKRLQEALEVALAEKKKIDEKWHVDFELLRTVNSDREEHLLQDCEWKLRSTEQACKAKVVAAEAARKEALEKAEQIEVEAKKQISEVQHLRSYEAEVAALRGLTSDQKESINSMIFQLDEMKKELETANKTVDESIETVRKIKFQCAQEISEKHRQMIAKIDNARYEVAVMWEDRLMEEMGRLKIELESCYAEDRAEALQTAHNEKIEEITCLTNTFNQKEKELRDEIVELKRLIADRNAKLQDANVRSDNQIMQIRVILDKSEREHQREMDAEMSKREEFAASMKVQHENDKRDMEEKFRERLCQVSEEFSAELTTNKEELQARHKKQLEQQWEKLMAEKEEAIQDLERSFKRKLIDAETKFRDLEISQQRAIKDMKNCHAMERSSLDQRDLQNAQEIETLHRKCRCLTKLFEEMRMRYERRDPRAEDLREIAELKNRCDAQDRDLRILTEKLRELQMEHQELEQSCGGAAVRKQKNKKSKLNCDVIYEENEERESPPNAYRNGNFE
ncbi:putative leucine-rich repeat-containing protein DDB_G0290503 isoform X1 [Bradysia coprophila]|uniref:putative leucine-rich repeat-containing protein DDB_G0290503 isoform X1 n=1 Tax=Bradysia coprophila TaxID=38358 RepID=UPI00187DD27C|nr:putative leucine-rich repeat-containing protein DDB_G0290503 isoform X1 [Bradysia coprophila]